MDSEFPYRKLMASNCDREQFKKLVGCRRWGVSAEYVALFYDIV